MSERNLNRNRIIGLRLRADEYEKVERHWKRSTCRKLSDYVRRVLLDKPVTMFYRDKSADDGLAEMAKVRTELAHLGNNFNQAVKRLHTLSTTPELKRWITVYELDIKIIQNKIEQLKMSMKTLTEKWLR